MNEKNKRYGIKTITADDEIQVIDTLTGSSVAVVVHITPALPYEMANKLAHNVCDALNAAYDAAYKTFIGG